MKTQHQKIYDYMYNVGGITPMDAFRDLGITKLSTRIGEMRRQGVQIESKMIQGRNSRYMCYWLKEEK